MVGKAFGLSGSDTTLSLLSLSLCKPKRPVPALVAHPTLINQQAGNFPPLHVKLSHPSLPGIIAGPAQGLGLDHQPHRARPNERPSRAIRGFNAQPGG